MTLKATGTHLILDDGNPSNTIFSTENKMPHIIGNSIFSTSSAIDVITTPYLHGTVESSGDVTFYNKDSFLDIDLGITAPIMCDFLLGKFKLREKTLVGYTIEKSFIVLPTLNRTFLLNGSTLFMYAYDLKLVVVGGFSGNVVKWPLIFTIQLIQLSTKQIKLRFRCSSKQYISGQVYSGTRNPVQTKLKFDVEVFYGKFS